MVNLNLINFQVKNENATLKGRNVMNEFEVANLKQELEKAKSTNQFLSTKIRKLETASNQMIGEKQILKKRNLEKLQLIQRKISNKYACEVCQKDWDSMNDFEKHLQKNRHGVQGELKIELSDGRVIITFVKNLVEDSDTIPIGLDVPVAIGNDPGKEDFIDDQISSEEFDLPEDINPEKSSFDVDQTFPKKVGCARCQNTFENFNNLTKHFSTAHGFNPSLQPEIFKRGMTKADLVEDLDTIPIGLDVPVTVGNDPGKEDFIDEQNIVQDLFQQPIPSQDLSTKVKESRDFARAVLL